MYGEKIKTIRLLRGFTQEYVADRLGIKQNTYSKLENGQTKLDVDFIMQLAEVLGVSQADILSPQPAFVNFENHHGEQKNSEYFYQQREFVEKIIASKDSEIQHLKEIICSLLKDKQQMLDMIRK